VRELVRLASDLTPGDPLSLADGEYGPLASRSGAEHLAGQVADAVAKGATLHVGGTLDGAYFAPAVLTGVTPQMRAYSEELFGPVAVVYHAGTEEQALHLANDTEFGLGAAVFSADVERAAAFASRIESGMVSINAPVAEGAELPFGGVKRSGFGRELGPLGIDEFVNKRLVSMSPEAEREDAMLERRDDWAYDYDLHDSTHPVRMQWHFYDTSNLPVAVQSWELPPGGDEGMHTHDRDENPKDEMYLITEGQARMTVDGTAYDLGPGDTVLAAAGVDHDLVNTGDTALRLIVVWGYHGHADYPQFGVTKAADARRRDPAGPHN